MVLKIVNCMGRLLPSGKLRNILIASKMNWHQEAADKTGKQRGLDHSINGRPDQDTSDHNRHNYSIEKSIDQTPFLLLFFMHNNAHINCCLADMILEFKLKNVQESFWKFELLFKSSKHFHPENRRLIQFQSSWYTHQFVLHEKKL